MCFPPRRMDLGMHGFTPRRPWVYSKETRTTANGFQDSLLCTRVRSIIPVSFLIKVWFGLGCRDPTCNAEQYLSYSVVSRTSDMILLHSELSPPYLVLFPGMQKTTHCFSLHYDGHLCITRLLLCPFSVFSSPEQPPFVQPSLRGHVFGIIPAGLSSGLSLIFVYFNKWLLVQNAEMKKVAFAACGWSELQRDPCEPGFFHLSLLSLSGMYVVRDSYTHFTCNNNKCREGEHLWTSSDI